MKSFLTMPKTVIIVLALATISGIAFWKFGPDLSQKVIEEKDITLNIWSLREDEALFKPVIEAYKKANPKVTINYNFQNSRNYRTRVQTQIANNQGPDIFMIHNSWLPMFLKTNTLSGMPGAVMTFDDYSKTFYPVVSDTLTKDGKVYAIPWGIDGLALYYNEDILKAAGVPVPQTWDQFVDAAIRATVIGQDGNIKTAGAAMGTTGNVDYWSDILGMLFFQQPGSSLENPTGVTSAEVVKFYTSFATDPAKKVWDVSMEPSTQAFASGRLALYFAPSGKASELKALNPQLNFKTAPVPQLQGRNIAWGTFWAYAVAANSPHQQQAWEFLKFLTFPDTQRFFGLPYPRVDMQKEQIEDPVIGAFVSQAPYYKSWYLSSQTADQGINNEIIKYYEDAVNAAVAGQSPLAALQTTAQGVKQVLDKYTAPVVPVRQR